MSKLRDQQAMNAVEKATNAVGQLDDNASGQLVEQAENSLIHANAAVGQARRDGDNSAAIQQAANLLEQDEQELHEHSRR